MDRQSSALPSRDIAGMLIAMHKATSRMSLGYLGLSLQCTT